MSERATGRPRRIVELPISCIRMDRWPKNSKALMYAIAMLRGDKFPPVRIIKALDGHYEIRDGRHRMMAARLVERGRIRAMYRDW